MEVLLLEYGDILNFLPLKNSPELDNVNINCEEGVNMELERNLIEKLIHLQKIKVKINAKINIMDYFLQMAFQR